MTFSIISTQAHTNNARFYSRVSAELSPIQVDEEGGGEGENVRTKTMKRNREKERWREREVKRVKCQKL